MTIVTKNYELTMQATRWATMRLLPYLLWAATVLVLSGCAAPEPESDTKRAGTTAQTLWPGLPDQPRFVHEIALRSAADIVQETEEGRLKRTLTGRADIDDKPAFNKPSAVAARGGRVYVADPASKAVIVFDMVRRRLYTFGRREPNLLERPISLAIDGQDQVYVLDGNTKRVMVFDGLGLFRFALGNPGSFTNPIAVAVSNDGQRIYVVDRGDVGNNDHKVVAYSPDGKELFRIGPRGDADGRFNIPLAATVSTDGTLYVADTGNFRIQAFDGDGKFRFAFGGVGAGLGQFSRARSIAVDQENNIYVSDGSFNNVQIFDSTGRFLMPLGRLSRDPGPGHYALIAGIGVDETNRLYVIDHYFKKIDVFRRLSDDEGQKLMTR